MSKMLTECVIRNNIRDREFESSYASRRRFFTLLRPPLLSRCSLSILSCSSLATLLLVEFVYWVPVIIADYFVSFMLPLVPPGFNLLPAVAFCWRPDGLAALCDSLVPDILDMFIFDWPNIFFVSSTALIEFFWPLPMPLFFDANKCARMSSWKSK